MLIQQIPSTAQVAAAVLRAALVKAALPEAALRTSAPGKTAPGTTVAEAGFLASARQAIRLRTVMAWIQVSAL
jgi:hypothetical protein